MKKLQQKQSGFSAVEVLLVIIAVAIVGFSSYYVYSSQKNSNAALKAASATTSKDRLSYGSQTKEPAADQSLLTQQYVSPQYKFSFKYPAAWKLATALKDSGRGMEGDIYVASPDGTKVHFAPDQGGFGGDCQDSQAGGKHTTRTCDTQTIYSAIKLANSGSEPIWLVKVGDTAPLADGGRTVYYVALFSAGYDDNGIPSVAPKVGTQLGAFLGTNDDVALYAPHGSVISYVSVSVEGKDDSQNNSKQFFDTKEVKEAIPILESFKAD